MVNNYKKDEEKTTFSWKNMGRMLRFVKPYKKELSFCFLMGLFSGLLILLIPKIIQRAVDVSFVNKDFKEILVLTFIMLILVILSIIITKIQRNKTIKILDKVSYDIKVAIFEKLQYLPENYFNTRSHGKIYTRATSYPDDVAAIFCYVIIQGLIDILRLIIVLVLMFTTNLKLSIISSLMAIVLIGFFVSIAPFRRRLQHKVNDKNSNVNAYVSESINGIRITQSFNREKKNEDIFKSLEEDRVKAFNKASLVNNLNWSLASIFDNVSMVLIYYIGFKYFYPTVSLGTIIAVDSYSSRFWDPIQYISTSYNDLMDASTYLERIFELLDEPLIIEDKSDAKEIDIKGNIELKNVTFSYDSNKNVLENLNLKIEAGNKIGLVGETGCGKSTILSLISRFYDINSGSIFIDGVDIKDIKLSSLRGQISVMLQDNFLFARSVYDNLVLDKKISRDEVIEIFKLLDIHDMIMSLDKGYDTILLNNASNLSNGERQLLCIARIMVQNPKVLILDEATSNIDLMTEKKIEYALKTVMKNRTTIMVAHRMSTIKNCDKIVLIKDHKNYEEGTHKELMDKKGEYFELYSHQML